MSCCFFLLFPLDGYKNNRVIFHNKNKPNVPNMIGKIIFENCPYPRSLSIADNTNKVPPANVIVINFSPPIPKIIRMVKVMIARACPLLVHR